MLKVSNVKKVYPGFELNCSLELLPGHVTGLIGPNGSGKTTLYKSILNLIKIDGGEIEIFGRPFKELSNEDKRNMGVVMAESGFSGYITIKDVRAILESFYPQFDGEFFDAMVARAGLNPKKKLKEYSTGMKVKVKLIAAMSHNAKLLILDEPTAGLDVIARDEILDYLREYIEKDEERSILISSHISSDLENFCDDLYMINEGQIILHEDTDKILSDYALLKLSEADYAAIDKQYILKIKKQKYGYDALTNQKGFYIENYPQITIQNGSIDELIMMMIGGESI